MKMKKLICILLICVILAVAFIGCELTEEDIFGSSNMVNKTTPDNKQSCDYSYGQLPVNSAVTSGPFKIKDANAPLYDGIVKYSGSFMFFYVKPFSYTEDPTILVSVGDDTVINITCYQSSGVETFVRLAFCQAGETTLQFTLLETGESVIYHITVKDNYECYPGNRELTPWEYAYCVSEIAKANGITIMNRTTNTYGVIALDDSDLTWEHARALAENYCHSWWSDGYREMNFVYKGEQPAGYMFYAYAND